MPNNKLIITTLSCIALICIFCGIIILSDQKDAIEKIVYCFTVASSLSILATIATYIMHKTASNKEKEKILHHYTTVIKKEKKKLKCHYEKLNDVYHMLERNSFDTVSVRFRKDSYSFIFNIKGRKSIIKSFFINEYIISMLSVACTDSIKAGIELYSPFRKIVDELITLDRRLYAVFLKYSGPKQTRVIINNDEINKIMKYELFTKRKRRINKINKIKVPTLH